MLLLSSKSRTNSTRVCINIAKSAPRHKIASDGAIDNGNCPISGIHKWKFRSIQRSNILHGAAIARWGIGRDRHALRPKSPEPGWPPALNSGSGGR